MRKRAMRQRLAAVERELADERAARHEAEVAAAAARGELRGYRCAVDSRTIAAREAARDGREVTFR